MNFLQKKFLYSLCQNNLKLSWTVNAQNFISLPVMLKEETFFFITKGQAAYFVFLVCSTAGEEVINKVALENRQAGREREEIKLDNLQEAIAQAVYNNNTSKTHFTCLSTPHS